jgi:uncharacterized OsmC-like protein
MDDQDRLREILERNAKAVTLRPSLAQHTGRTVVRLRPGLECEVEDGAWRLTVGMGEKSGGNNAGPGPGTLGRGALGSCLAIGYGMWAARLGVPLHSLEVEVAADYDSRGELGVSDDVRPGYTQVRYTVTVDSPASREDVLRVLDTADKYSPYRDIFADSNDVQRTVRFPGGGA